MIDMSGLYAHNDYQAALNSFKHCKWNCFSDVQMKVSNNRCPICECSLDNSVNGFITRLNNKGNNTEVKPTVDHYRPKAEDLYPFLKCDHKNYLLMCSECNNIYKGCKFPLYGSGERAINKAELQNEQPLIVNPLYDNLLELFVLVFKRSSRGKNILELKPKPDISTAYPYAKALETIRLFGLGDCEVNRHANDNIYNCRISILESHFGVFYEFAKALKTGNRQRASKQFKDHKELFQSYGFFNFLKKSENFEVHI